jgi:hypothetical protein
VNAPAATDSAALGPTPVAVKVAVYDVPEPENAESVPFVALTSATVKLVEASLSVNVTVDVRLDEGVTVDGDGEMMMVGDVVSAMLAPIVCAAEVTPLRLIV